MHTELTPTAAATLAGMPYRREKNLLATVCPACGGTAVIRGNSFLCADRCAFDRGGPLDALAARVGGYKAALEMSGGYVPYYADKAADLAPVFAARRRLLEFFAEAAAAPADDTERINLRHKFAKLRGLEDPDAFPRSCVYLTEKEVNTLLLLLLKAGVDTPAGIQNRALVANLYWSDHHTLSHISLTETGARGGVRFVELAPVRIAWFGLNNARHNAASADIFPSGIDAMAVAAHYSLHTPGRFPTALLVSKRHAGTTDVPFDDIRFMGRELTWEKTLPGWSHFPDFEERVFSDAACGDMDLKNLMAVMLRRLVDSGEDGMDRYIDMCGGMLLGDGIRTAITNSVLEAAGPEWAERIRRCLSRRLLDRVDGSDIFSSDTGYEVVTDGETKAVSNFTLEMRSITGFSSHADLSYGAILRIGDFETAVELPAKQFENPRELEKALAALQFDRQAEGSGSLSVIHDHREFAKVLSVLRRQAAGLPRIRGIRTLGWSRSRDSYATPVAVALGSGIQETASFRPRDGSVHTCYRERGSVVLVDKPARPRLCPDLAEVVGVLVAQMIRSHNNLTVRPLAVLNTSDNRRLGLRLFRELGQTGPLWLEDILPRTLEDNKGLPCLINGLKELQGPKAPMAGLWMSEKGIDLSKFKEEEIDAAAQSLPHLLLKTAEKLIGGTLDSFKEKRSVELLNAFAREGAAVIQTEYWKDWPEAGYRWRAIDTVLEMGEKQIVKLVRVRTTDDTVDFQRELWKDLPVDRDDIIIEMGLRCAQVAWVQETGSIRVDKNSAYRMLDAYYGEVPRLETAGA
jgi:hypothetical protein